LFDLAAWKSFKAGDAAADAAEADFESSKQALIIRSAQAYFDTLLAASNLDTSRAQEDALHHQLKQTKQRFDVGLSAITEVHEAQAAYDSSVAERLLAEGRLGIAFEGIEVLTGQPFDTVSNLRQDFSAAPPQPQSREDWVDLALEKNYALQAAKFTSDSFEYNAQSAKAGHYPTLSFNGQYSHSDDESAIGSTQLGDTETDTQSIGLTLRVPLYAGGRTSSLRRQAKQQAIQSRENYLKLKRDIVQNARSQHLNVVTGVSTVKARAQAIVSRESALEATQAGYRVGTRDLVDVLNAQQTLYQAKRDYNTAVFDYIISSLNLKEVAGQLTEADILSLNNWLDAGNQVERFNQ
jgi:outer membrane protein